MFHNNSWRDSKGRGVLIVGAWIPVSCTIIYYDYDITTIHGQSKKNNN